VDAPAFEPRENRVAAPRHRTAAAGDAGHRAWLGRAFLRCRRLHQRARAVCLA
jgi:hypothetical protein